ncbi:protein kinase [Streptomyces polyrhachis]|uniref:Protein kinase n=1 Tax=Streptomyces polyrhachis TaxID=1282885 RepID=A0ABW2GPP4_9ACTN
MDEYAGRVLAGRYRLPADEPEALETRAFDTYSGQEVAVREVPLPEVVDAEGSGEGAPPGSSGGGYAGLVRRALEAARAAAAIPDHPRLDQVFDVFEEDGSIWIASELVPARPLAEVIARRPLGAYRGAEVAADVLTALRALHAHGWVHRNITARTVLVCDDGRVVLSGLAAGAAEDALCGYDVLPQPAGWGQPPRPSGTPGPPPGGVPTLPMGADGRIPELPGPSSGFRSAEAHSPSAAAAYRAGTQAAAARLAGGPAYTDRVVAGGGPPSGARAGASIAVPARRGGEVEERDRSPRGGPRTRLDAERARQTRMQLVGAVVERWAPEQAVPVHEHWRLAPPVGPAADLWALGALLFRAVQGHSAYPEESVAELVQLVCAEPPALAEECGALRPVVESLLRQDPVERPDFEELRGWLRSLIRTAPEPDLGSRTVTVPTLPPGRSDPRRLPILRRRGELVRRRERASGGGGRGAAPVRSSPSAAPGHGGRHKHRRERGRGPARRRAAGSLGRWLIALVFLLMAAAIAFAVLFLPKAEEGGDGGQRRQTVGGAQPSAAGGRQDDQARKDDRAGKDTAAPEAEESPAAELPAGFALRKDRAGFEVAVHEGWQRLRETARGAVRYASPDGVYELLVAPGRDTTARFGADPMDYQLRREPELAAQRASDWGESSGLQTITVGTRLMATGRFTWQAGDGRERYGRNMAMVVSGRYHVVLVSGPAGARRAVDVFYQQAAATYRLLG